MPYEAQTWKLRRPLIKAFVGFSFYYSSQLSNINWPQNERSASQYISINLSEINALGLLSSLIFGNYSKETFLGQRQEF
jgi:hypothetical protein